MCVEPEVNAAKENQRPDHQSGSGKQDERQGEFGNHQDATQAVVMRSFAATSAPLFE